MKRNEPISIDAYLDSTYHSRVPAFPEIVRDNDTDDHLAWKLGRIAIKARHVVFNLVTFHASFTSTRDLYVMLK